MNDWRQAVQQYQTGVQSIAQSNLSNKEALLQGKASLLTAKTGQLESMTGEKFSDKLKEEANKFATDIGIDISAGATAPTILRGAQYLTQKAQRATDSAWKTTQARRFAQTQKTTDETPIGDDTNDVTGTLPSGNDAITSARQVGDQVSEDTEGLFTTLRSAGRSFLSRFTTAPTDGNQAINDIKFEDARFVDPGETPYINSLPEGVAQNATRMGSIVRDVRGVGSNAGYSGSATSNRIGDAINEAEGETKLQSNVPIASKPRPPANVDEEFGDEPIQEGMQQSIQVRPTEIGGRGPLLETTAQPEVDQAKLEESELGQEAEQEGTAAVEDLAPELTGLSSALGSVSSALGTAIPLVGFGLGLYGLAESIKSAKDEASGDPYASIRPQLQQAQGRINQIQSQVSADEFASKIGARPPQFGSIAARPTIDTALQQSIALHI